jgi:hypothetical protein
MTRLESSLQTARCHGYLFAIIDRASYLGAGTDIEYIISKHKTYAAANRAILAIMKIRGPGNYGDLRIKSTTAAS